MKTAEEIENISFDELEAVADNRSITVPEELKDRIKSAVIAKEVTGERGQRGMFYGIGISLAAAAVAMAVLLNIRKEPADTFSSPEEAYLEVAKTFAYISKTMDKAVNINKL